MPDQPRQHRFSPEIPIVNAFVWLLAGWAVLIHLAVSAKWSWSHVLSLSPVVLIAAVIGWVFCRDRSGPIQPGDDSPPTDRHVIYWLILAAVVVASRAFGYVPFWTCATLLLLAGLTRAKLAPPPTKKGTSKFISAESMVFLDENTTSTIHRPRENNLGCPLFVRGGIDLLLLCAAGVFITLLLHQPDIDDSFYISVATDAHRHPDRAIWSTDTVHDDPNLPVFLPIYKAEAYEHLISLTAKALHLTCVRADHTALPVIFSVLVVLAWVMLARLIQPTNWLAIVAVTMVVALYAGAAKQGPANYTFTRLQQGKSVMVSAIVPIVCFYAFRFATAGGWRNAIMLAVTQIAGVGLSSTAILIGPAVACAVGFLSIPWFPPSRSLRYSEEPDRAVKDPAFRRTSTTVLGILAIVTRLIVIGLTCIYPMSMALLMRDKMLAVTWIANSPLQPVTAVLAHILGENRQLYFFLAAAIAAWIVVPRRSATLLLAPPILLLGIMINPLLVHFLQTHIFSPITYWRGLWVVPWLIWSAVLVCGISSLVGSFVGRWIPSLRRVASIAFGCAALMLMLGAHPIWAHQNGTFARFASLAVDEKEYAVATQLAAQTPPGTWALAPELVACWTAVQDNRPPLIFVRSFYTQSSPQAGIKDVQMRNQLGEIAGRARLGTDDVATLLAGIDRYHLGGIVLRADAGALASAALKQIGFHSQIIGDYMLWIRR